MYKAGGRTMKADAIEEVIDILVKKAEEDGYDEYWYYGQVTNSEYLLKDFFEHYYEVNEGMACCSDKATFTVGAIRKMIEKKSDVPLQYTYREYRDNGGNIGGIKELDEICYWCPKTLKTAQKALDIFLKETVYRWKNMRREE